MLTISGWLAFVLYAALRTGSADTWFRAQRGGWSESFDVGVHFVYEIGAFLAFSRRDLSDLFFIATAVVVIGGLFIVYRVRLPAMYAIYTVAVLVPALTSASPRVGSSVLVLAFPIVIAAARLAARRGALGRGRDARLRDGPGRAVDGMEAVGGAPVTLVAESTVEVPQRRLPAVLVPLGFYAVVARHDAVRRCGGDGAAAGLDVHEDLRVVGRHLVRADRAARAIRA